MRSWLVPLVAALQVSVSFAKPTVHWSVPGEVQNDPRHQDLRLVWASDDDLISRLEWLPEEWLLAIEGLQYNKSNALLFDPEKAEFRGKIEARDYLWDSSVAGERLVWASGGEILWAKPGDKGGTRVWESGLGEGGDDYPSMQSYRVQPDGGFAAVLDNGGWQHGARIFYREGKDGKVMEAPVVQDLMAVDLSFGPGRVWATGREKGWFAVLDFNGKVVSEANDLLPEAAWEIAAAPSGRRAAVVDSKNTLWIIDVP